MRKLLYFIVAVVAVGILGACKPGVPRGVVKPGDMEEILYDYYIARSMATQGDDVAYKQRAYRLAVLKKHGVTEAEFDSSLVYYYAHSEEFAKVYAAVQRRLEGEAQAVGASAGEMNKYASLGATGDTAEIWNGPRRALLMPIAPYNRLDFHLEADSSYRRGDHFQLILRSLFMYQSGTRDAIVYVAVDYEGDSTATFNRRLTLGEEYQLSIPANHEAAIKAIRGFVYLGNGLTQSPLQKLMFIDGVQLVRFHPQEADVKAAEDEKMRKANEEARRDSLRKADSLTVKPVLQKMKLAQPITR